MTLSRCRPLSEVAARAASWLLRAEAQVALLDRVRPRNLAAEKARLVRALEAGQRPLPQFEYAPGPPLGELRRQLEELAATLAGGATEERLLAARARELELDAALAEQVGTPAFSVLASRRFPLPDSHVAVAQLAGQFVTAGPEPAADTLSLHEADDARDPQSLWTELSRLVARERLPVRIEAVAGLASMAAVAEGVVRVRAGAKLSVTHARRIALHEVYGHVRPRALGAGLGGVFAAGSAASSEDEEGRAILLEERAGLLDSKRRRELGRRYLAAESVRLGADFWQTLEGLGKLGASIGQAVELCCRVHRGGGLGRELVYLSGYVKVAGALAQQPSLERVMESGRVSVEAARALLLDSIQLDDDRDMV